MISTRRKKQDKDKESIIIIAMQQKKLWEKYFSANDSRTKLECISKLHELTLDLVNLLQHDDYIMQQNYNLYNFKKSSSPLKIGKLSNSPNTKMILSRFINNSDEDLR